MNKIFKLFFVFALLLVISSCNKDDDTYVEPLRDYGEQYAKDLDSINKFIDTHYLTVDANYNVTFSEILAGGTQQSIRQQTDYPLDFTMVQNDDQDVNYKLYFIKLRQGSGRYPTAVDSVHVAYKGENIFTNKVEILPSTEPVKTYRTFLDVNQFDFSSFPVWFQLQDLVPGWAEIIPKFRTGVYDVSDVPNPNPVNFQEYGAGIMFLPSALGYYANSSASGTIPSYAPLIFSFKLMELRYKDHDRDGILSKDEGNPNDPTMKLIDYDSDGDGTANMYDVDDDGDYVLTKNELKYTYTDGSLKKTRYYPYNGAATDDPSTSWDETKGIPRAFTGPLMPVTIAPSTIIMLPSPGPGDFTDPTRLRRHLDPNAKPPFYDQY